MKIVLKEDNKYILRFDRGEEVLEELSKFCQKEDIKAGHFSAIGAADEVILSSFDIAKKDYRDKVIKGEMEIVGIMGNVSVLQSKVIIHTHGVFSDKKFRTYAGHLKKLVVSVTCEVVLERLEGKVERGHDEKTGLNLMR